LPIGKTPSVTTKENATRRFKVCGIITSMNIITEPTVYLLGKQNLQQAELDRFLADHGVSWSSDSEVAAEVINEVSGRICYMSFAKPRPGGNSAYLHHIKEVGHGSVLESAVWNFIIVGISRSLTHELVRHRAGWAYSMLSQRYVDESVAEYVCPPDLQEQIDEGYGEWTSRWVKADFGIDEYLMLRGHHRDGTISDDAWVGIEWLFAVGVSHRAYGVLSGHLTDKAAGRFAMKTDARKFARQGARSVLPNATETKISVTVNARAARHFLEQRGSRHAEPEIRKLANTMLDILVADAPNLFGDYVKTPLPDGTYELSTPYPKV
jgi:thymidylate synthase (FAD)